MNPFTEKILSLCRHKIDSDDIIYDIVSSTTKELNERLLKYIEDVQKNSLLYPTLKKEEWYITCGQTKIGGPRLFLGEALLNFRVFFVSPHSGKDSSQDSLRDFDARYFLRYSKARNMVTAYESLLNDLCVIGEAKTYLLQNTERFLLQYLKNLRQIDESSGTVRTQKKVHQLRVEVHQVLWSISRELRLRRC